MFYPYSGEKEMSHFRKCTVQLNAENVDMGLLMLAVKEIAGQLGLKTTDTVKDYYGRTRKVLIAVEGLYGVYYSKDEGLQIIGDEFGKKIKLDDFHEMLVRTYTSLAVQRVLADMGYSVTTERKGESVLVYGVRI